MSNTTLATGILALAALAVIVFLSVSANRKRKAIEDVPPAMRPAYSDEQLETSIFERYQAWGLIMTLFFAVFFPLYYFNESNRLNAEAQEFFVASVVRGEESYKNLCANCHGTDGGGGAAPSPTGEGFWPAPNLLNIVKRYEDNRNVKDIELFIRSTIERGRPGTPMPTWGAGFGGSLNDQQVDDLVNWILASQIDEVDEATAASNLSGEQLFSDNCAKCHGADLQGDVGPALTSVFSRHSEATILEILRNGIIVPTGANMPPWQQGYMYAGARYTDDALERILEYLRSRQTEAPADDTGEDEPQPAPTTA
ncbi:MAG TPA: c-type cytochrome [Egibacteraceae bacterium]|nr:c-type cytochrome [Egibacteraceae bacterium]